MLRLPWVVSVRAMGESIGGNNLSFKFISILMLLAVLGCTVVPTVVSARVFPASAGDSEFRAMALRNFDEFSKHWGAGLGYCWKGRISADLEWRGDGLLGEDHLQLQAELAVIRTAGFALESGYYYTLKSSRRRRFDIIPLRTSFLFETFDNLNLSPSMTVWIIPDDRIEIPVAFAGLDIYWERRISLGFELNLNQDFRYHQLDVKLGYHW